MLAMIRKFFFLLIISLLSFFSPICNADTPSFDIVNQITNGPSYDVAALGNYLYAAQGQEIRVYDVSSRSTIQGLTWKTYVSRIPILDPIKALETEQHYLHVASTGKYTIIDIANPIAPIVIASLDTPYAKGEIRDVDIKGNTAYLSIAGFGIQVVDITDRRNPIYKTKIALGGANNARRSSLAENYLYVAQERARLDILDVSTPLTPVQKGSYTASSSNAFSGVAVKDGYAYVTEYHQGIRILDVSNPAAPTETGSIMGVNANDVSIHGSHVYVSIRYQGFNIYAITSPGSLQLAGKGTGMPGYIEGICPVSGYTFLAGESFGFAVYDSVNPASPQILVNVPVIGGVDSLAESNGYLYLGAHNYGIWVVDIQNTANPREVVFLKIGGRNRDMSVQNNMLYIAGESTGLNRIDISDPLNPRPVFLDFGDNIWTVLADGNFVYTSAGIVDISVPTSPQYIFKSPLFGGKFARYGDRYLLVADADGADAGLRVIDVQVKQKPVELVTFDKGVPYKDVYVFGNLVVALTGNDVVTFDLANVAKPLKLGQVSYAGTWSGYALSGSDTLVYAAGGPRDPLKILDVSDPVNIRLVAQSGVYGRSYSDVCGKGSFVFAGDKWGVDVVGLRGMTVPTSSPTPAPTPTPSTTPTTPSPTPAPSQISELYIESNPNGAVIYIDGVKLGKTPSQLTNVIQGTHTLVLKMDNYYDFVSTINVIGGEKNVFSCSLVSKSEVYINSYPIGAIIYLDNQKMGKTPSKIPSVSPGWHNLRLTKENYIDYNGNIYVPTNVVKELSIKLSRMV